MNCVVCNTPLSGGIDTFGDIGIEMCWKCWSERGDAPEGGESWYGLAPHKHSYSANGNIIIGGTCFLPLPPPESDGSYKIGGLTFVPDPDAPNCGTWSS